MTLWILSWSVFITYSIQFQLVQFFRFYRGFQHLLPSGRESNIEASGYLQSPFLKNGLQCDVLVRLIFIYKEKQFFLVRLYGAILWIRFKCEGRQNPFIMVCLSLSYSGLNTYWHTSHMRAKNRNHPHCHHQLHLRLSSLPIIFYSLTHPSPSVSSQSLYIHTHLSEGAAYKADPRLCQQL